MSRRALATTSSPSGVTRRSTTRKPAFSNRVARRGPAWSTRVPAAVESETVRIFAVRVTVRE
jgi:hypothetical protein